MRTLIAFICLSFLDAVTTQTGLALGATETRALGTVPFLSMAVFVPTLLALHFLAKHTNPCPKWLGKSQHCIIGALLLFQATGFIANTITLITVLH